MKLANALAMSSLSIVSFACKKDEDTKYSKAKIAMANEGLSLATTGPSTFGAKIASIILIADKDGDPTAENNYGGNNTGEGAKLWGAPECTITTKDENSGAFTMDFLDDAECEAAGIKFLDLNRSSAEVNAELNSQEAKILPGSTFKYIGISLLGGQQGGNNGYTNAQWAYESSGVAERSFASVQTEWGAKFETPLTVGEGETVTVVLSYQLDNTVHTGVEGGEAKVRGGGTLQPGRYDDCNEAGDVCFNFPALSVTVTK